MSRPKALITGISGQDGSYLAELLLEKGYEVWGIVRSSTTGTFPNLAAVKGDVTLMQGDLLDQLTLVDALTKCQPDELYNLAATSFVPASWRQPVMTAQFTAVGVTSMLEAVRLVRPATRIYQASSSELFGAAQESPQNEGTPFAPHTPYGVAKLYGHLMVATYRQRYGLHASSGIAFNHESPRRPAEFVTGKVARAAAAIKLGFETSVTLGDLSAQRDWGAAKDYVDAMWRMLQQPEADDFVIATGRAHSVQDLVNAAFAHVGLRADDHVIVDPELVRPPDPTPLVGDPSKARHALGWKAETSFADLVGSMVESHLRRLRAASDSDRTANVP